MDDPVETAVFGKQVEDFLSGEIGRFLVSNAEREVDAAVEALKRCDPIDANRIRDLQAIIWRGENFQRWLAEAIMNGQQALSLLEGE